MLKKIIKYMEKYLTKVTYSSSVKIQNLYYNLYCEHKMTSPTSRPSSFPSDLFEILINFNYKLCRSCKNI